MKSKHQPGKSTYLARTWIVLLSFGIAFSESVLAQSPDEALPSVPDKDPLAKEKKFGVDSIAPNSTIPSVPTPPEVEPVPPEESGIPLDDDFEPPPLENPSEAEGSGFIGVPQVEGPTVIPNPNKKGEADMPSLDREETEKRVKAPSEIRLRSSRFLEGKDSKPYSLEEARDDLYGGRASTYRLNISLAQPSFLALDDYKAFYGDPSLMPYFSVESFLWRWFVNLGVVFKVGYYSDTGRAVTRNSGNLTSDLNSPIDLTLIPLQLGGVIDLSPFPARWIRLSAWFSYEATYFEEVRYTKADDVSSSTTSKTLSPNIPLDEFGSADSPFVNGGWKKAVVTGFAANIRIDSLDGKASASMTNLGLGAVYFSPFMEMVKATPKEGFDLSRSIVGASLSFESR